MKSVKQTCREVAATPHVMTFSDLATAAASGAVFGQKVNNPFVGAVLGVSLEAGKRAVMIAEELMQELTKDTDIKPEQKAPMADPKPGNAVKPKT